MMEYCVLEYLIRCRETRAECIIAQQGRMSSAFSETSAYFQGVISAVGEAAGLLQDER
jgi:hypothetical protein